MSTNSNTAELQGYSLWTAPQSSRATILVGVEIRLPETAADAPSPDPEIEERKRAFATAVDPEGLIRSVYR